MALVAVVGLNADRRDADPKGTYALIFGIVGVFLILLFFFQSRDLSRGGGGRGEARSRRTRSRTRRRWTSRRSGRRWRSSRSTRTRSARARTIWGAARGSMRLGMLICVLIFLAVPPIYLLDTFVPLLIGAPLIALHRAVEVGCRCSAAAATSPRRYEAANRAMAPLGLALTERLTITIEPKSVAPFRLGPGVHGATGFAGERHGRQVTVRMPADESVRSLCQVRVEASRPRVRVPRARRAAEGGGRRAARRRRGLKSVPNSPRWNGLKGKAAPDGIEVEHKGVRDTATGCSTCGSPSGWLKRSSIARACASASHLRPRAPSTSGARAPRSTTGCSRAARAASSCCASRTPTASARRPRTSSRSSTR